MAWEKGGHVKISRYLHLSYGDSDNLLIKLPMGEASGTVPLLEKMTQQACRRGWEFLKRMGVVPKKDWGGNS